MSFEYPALLWLALPWLVFWWFFARLQWRSVAWIEQHVDTRFRALLTRHDRRTLTRHLALLAVLGLALVVAASGPYYDGRGEVIARGGPLILVLDASASMYATDLPPAPLSQAGRSAESEGGSADEGAEPEQRFENARRLSSALLDYLEPRPVGLVTYSGVATLHLPPVDDRPLIDDALAAVEPHAFYQRTGSSLQQALDAISRLLDPRIPEHERGLQVVLVGDGEIPHQDDYRETLAALADQGIVIHTMAVGSEQGQAREIYDFRDVMAGKEERTVLVEYTTRRVDEHFRAIARATGGTFVVGSEGAPAQLAVAIRETDRRGRRVTLEDRSSRRDLSMFPLLVFLLGWLAERFLVGRGGEPPDHRFRIEALGTPRRGTGAALVSALLVLQAGCGSSPLLEAHRANERGIELDENGLHGIARGQYQRSIGFQIRPEIPTHNLGRSALLREDYSEAHSLLQHTLELEPRLAEAHYHDGVALYRWGEAIRDPRGCELERTRELWRQALLRFEGVPELTDREDPLARDATSNHQFVRRRLVTLEALILDPPPECGARSQGGGGGGEDGDEEQPSGGGGGEDGDEEQSSGGGSDGDEEQPTGSGGGGEDGDEQPPPGGGAQPPPSSQEPGQDDGAGGGSELSDEELAQIRAELDRIRQQALGEGKFFRRTRPEQFGKDAWSNPDAEIWW